MEKAYYMSIVDIFTHYTWIYFLNWKSDVVKHFLQFYKHAKKQLSIVLKYVPIDGGGELKHWHLTLLNMVLNIALLSHIPLTKMEYLK